MEAGFGAVPGRVIARCCDRCGHTWHVGPGTHAPTTCFACKHRSASIEKVTDHGHTLGAAVKKLKTAASTKIAASRSGAASPPSRYIVDGIPTRRLWKLLGGWVGTLVLIAFGAGAVAAAVVCVATAIEAAVAAVTAVLEFLFTIILVLGALAVLGEMARK